MTVETTSPKTLRDLPGPKPRVDKERDTQEAIIEDAGERGQRPRSRARRWRHHHCSHEARRCVEGRLGGPGNVSKRRALT